MNISVTNNNYIKPQTNRFRSLAEPITFCNGTSDNNNQSPLPDDRTLQQVWSIHNFETAKKVQLDHQTSFGNMPMSWAADTLMVKEATPEKSESEEEFIDEKIEVDVESSVTESPEKNEGDNSPAHHARRPMNAFLIFCKKHRPVVRDKFRNLENRGVTRILGEWWALLNTEDRQPYTDLAKEYKDAFMTANPDFKWYKLPAPPLRTLSTRPNAPLQPQPPAQPQQPPQQKVSAPLSSPPNNHLTIPEFTPGKLADESQLGGLTSLMQNFSPSPPPCKQLDFTSENNNNSPGSLTKNIIPSQDTTSLPPKPMKKRIFEQYDEDTKKLCEENENITKQDLLEKVVEGIFSKPDLQDNVLIEGLERKTNRRCKGKRYEMFMSKGKSFKRSYSQEVETKLNVPAPKLDLGQTINKLNKRLQEDINGDGEVSSGSSTPKTNERQRTISETSDSAQKSSPTSTFNIDLRILNLPSLSYEMYLQRKRDSKKRKKRTKTDGESKRKLQKTDHLDEGGSTQLVGSKKRKNKRSITHLGLNKVDSTLNGPATASADGQAAINGFTDLATLAEIAANKEKINETISQ